MVTHAHTGFRYKTMSLQDSLTIGYMVFYTGMVLFAMFTLGHVLSQSDVLMGMDPFVAAIDALMLFDYASIGVVVASTVASVFLASRIEANPVFLPISMVFLGVATFVAYALTVVPDEMAEHTVVAEVFGDMVLTSIVLSNLHVFVFVAGLMGMVATYALSGNRRGGGGRRAPL